MHLPSPKHFEVVCRILRYLKWLPRKGLLFEKHDHLLIEVYTNTNWIGGITNKKSTSSYYTFFEGSLVTWCSKKQNVVARNNVEAEFRSVAYEICDMLSIKKILDELKILSLSLMKAYYDNKAAISIAQNHVLHEKLSMLK